MFYIELDTSMMPLDCSKWKQQSCQVSFYEKVKTGLIQVATKVMIAL